MSCPECQKATRKQNESTLDPKIAVQPVASILACNISPAKTPTMSVVHEVLTTPIAIAGANKRKLLSPGVNSPPLVVVEDKSIKLMENAADSLLSTPATIPTPATVIAQPNVPKSIPQINLQNPGSGLRNRT